MLEQTNRDINSLPPDLWKAVETMAGATLKAELAEDLLGNRKSDEVVESHRSENTEEWRRALAGSLSALKALHKVGYNLVKENS